MSIANPLWQVPWIHGELLKLGIDVAKTTVANYMAKRKSVTVARLEDLRSQSWRRYPISELFVAPTISFPGYYMDYLSYGMRGGSFCC